MTVKEFVRMVADGSENGGYEYFALKREDGFVGYTGKIFCDNCICLSRANRVGHLGYANQDWTIGKAEVKSITIINAYGRSITCAIID